ncbi:MAG: outer membrane protein assembly factor BamD [Desulfomicrobium sp.]|nr:outer membrane protein assembly factor BamD [Desulfomicrobium sp.]NLV97739.1 outer membrane protein assembly factor BamD [Desulfovibrionales bacterium]
MRKYLFLLVLVFFMNGCGIIDHYFITPPEDTAQELFENARAHMNEKEYDAAINQLTALNDRYPFSPYAVQTRLMLGDAYFLDQRYDEAVDVYDEFLSLHPRHESVDYVLFQMGVSKYKSHKSIDLPQNELAEAVESFQHILDAYPQSTYREDSLAYIVKCRTRMAEHELFVADFYFKSSSYKAAWTRYTYVVDNFPELPEIVEYADTRAKVAFFHYQQEENTNKRHPSFIKNLFRWL